MEKINSIEVLKSGTGKSGKPWTLVKAHFDGQNVPHTGFVYDSVPTAGEEMDVEFFQEEYNGKMQDKFRRPGTGGAAKKSGGEVTEMAIKMAIVQATEPLRRKLDLILKHHEIKDIEQQLEDTANIEPKDIPF